MAALKILLVSVCSLISGAAGLTAVLSGPQTIPLAPIFALFGWYFLPFVLLMVGLMWLLWARRFGSVIGRLLYVVLGAATGAGVMALCGLGATDLAMRDGVTLGGVFAGITSNLLITVLHSSSQPGASPNSGPAERFGNSEVGGGPPSVS